MMAPDWTMEDDQRAEQLVALARRICLDDAHAATVLCTASFGLLAESIGPKGALSSFTAIQNAAARAFSN